MSRCVRITKHKHQQRSCILVHNTHTTQEASANSSRGYVTGAILYCHRYKRSYVLSPKAKWLLGARRSATYLNCGGVEARVNKKDAEITFLCRLLFVNNSMRNFAYRRGWMILNKCQNWGQTRIQLYLPSIYNTK